MPSPDDDGGGDAADVDETVDVPDQPLSFEVTSESPGDSQPTGLIKVKARLASMHYLHTRPFLNELQLCASDFHHFTDQVAVSLSTAAAGVAKGIVGQKEALKESMVYLSKSFGGPVEMAEEDVVDGRPPESSSGFPSKVYLNFDMMSPVVYLPKALDSRDMFVAYLGHISASNDYVRSDENGLLRRSARVSTDGDASLSMHSRRDGGRAGIDVNGDGYGHGTESGHTQQNESQTHNQSSSSGEVIGRENFRNGRRNCALKRRRRHRHLFVERRASSAFYTRRSDDIASNHFI